MISQAPEWIDFLYNGVTPDVRLDPSIIYVDFLKQDGSLGDQITINTGETGIQ